MNMNTTNATTENYDLNHVAEEYRQAAMIWMPCNLLSDYHDLKCGHRIESRQHNRCGSNCITPGPAAPFLCIECIIEGVEDGLGLRSENEPLLSQILDTEYKVSAKQSSNIAAGVIEDKIQECLSCCLHREGRPVRKFNCIAAFLRKFPEARKSEPRIEALLQEFEEMSVAPFLEMEGMADALQDLTK